MFVEDVRTGFYNLLPGNRVLLIIHHDIDAVCSYKILNELFKCDNILYSYVPVWGKEDLKRAYEDNSEEIKYIVLVNCGATIDLVDFLQPEEDVVFFLLDSHKPTNVCNIYSEKQVRVLHRDDDENIPNYDDIFRDDEDEEEEEELERGQEGLEAMVERRRAKRAWEENRHKIMFDYTQFTYYGKPSALLCIELATRLSRCGLAAVWAGCVAAAAARTFRMRSSPRCLLDAEPLYSRLGPPPDPNNMHAAPAIVAEKDTCLPLCRVWSLENAIRHAPEFAPSLKFHTVAGSNRLKMILADMGIPLAQARQVFFSMDLDLQEGLVASLQKVCDRYQLPCPAAPAFLLHRPYSPQLSSIDLAYCILGLLDHITIPHDEKFQYALAVLDIQSGDNDSRRLGFLSVQHSLEAVSKVVNSTLSEKRLFLAGPFSYFIVQEGTSESVVMRSPMWLGVAARWAATACNQAARPLIACANLPDGDCLLLGLPPSFHQDPRNLFGAAFEEAANSSGASVSFDYFDSSIIRLPISQRSKFLDALTALLN